MGRGCIVASAVAVCALLGAVTFAAVRPFEPQLLDPEARAAALRILWVAGGYSALVIAAFGPFLSGSPDVRSLTTVVLLFFDIPR